jgi:hypothetical protein
MYQKDIGTLITTCNAIEDHNARYTNGGEQDILDPGLNPYY